MEKINWYGTYCLTKREVKRFLRVYHQTVFTPMILSLIYLAVFELAIGTVKPDVSGIKFVNFMGYGLIIMSIVQNAFSNSASSFTMSKILGYIIDILTPPFAATEIIIAYTIGAILRGVMVGGVVSVALLPFIDYTVYHPVLLVFFVLTSCALVGQFGILAGIIASTFDQLSAFTSYVITPLSFLSGTFYSVQNLPTMFQVINQFNPFFYMIDGFRFCLTNHVDGSIEFGAGFLIISNILMYILLTRLINAGWRIKS